MKTENTVIPLILMGILVLGSFAPIIQIILLHGSAIYLYPFENILGIENFKVLNFMHLVGGILTVYGFYKAEKIEFKLLWAILTVFFLNSFLTFLWDDKGGDPDPYFLGFMISGFLTTLPLLVIGFVKEKRIKK
ncbi:hypothetical protein [Flagellimonas iocasae]|uniref:DUF4383 domain-containing protein n=1 Tax=Flagellimonas iocasae TaxID=2055905 RepID=A0ABW4XUU0_9FLAO